MLRIVYWFYYRWSPPYNHIYIHLWFQVLFHLETCFRDNRTRSELAHFYIFIAQGMCVWCVMLGNIFFRKILFRHQFIWICAKEISGENFFSSYVYTYISNISVIYQDKISKVDYLHTLSFYSENFFKWICLYNDLPH